jgi:predicted enzyme related to lactoylglutathione lyase
MAEMSARLIEVELRVADVDRSRRFYRDLIGVEVADLERHGADAEAHAHATWGTWSRSEPSLLMLNLYPAGPGGPTKTHLGFVVGDLDATHERLRAAGVNVVRAPETRPWGRTAAYADPDGNTVSLTEAPR